MGRGVRDCGQRPSENIWTFNNFLRECHGGSIAAGSHTGAGICGMLVAVSYTHLNALVAGERDHGPGAPVGEVRVLLDKVLQQGD